MTIAASWGCDNNLVRWYLLVYVKMNDNLCIHTLPGFMTAQINEMVVSSDAGTQWSVRVSCVREVALQFCVWCNLQPQPPLMARAQSQLQVNLRMSHM